MIKIIIILLLLSNFLIAEQLLNVHCDCTSIKVKIDCLSSYKNCYWQEDGEFCVEEKNNQSQNIIIKEKQQYCQQFIDMKTCLKIESCAWILLDKIYSCQTFPGCNFYQNTTHEECQSYSTLCISDGITCVQKHQNCIDYETQMSCEFIQQPQQYYCYWAMNLCLQANFCDLLPKSLNTDEQCRTAMKTCTVNIDQGCIDSGLNCSDQKNESQCYWNLDQTIQCIWVNNECFERNCKTLAQQLKTSNCKRDIKNYKCYEDGQNGCSEILVCQNLKSLSSCQNYQQECYWDVNTCIKRECYYAPNSFNTWEQCQDFSKECIPKLLYGCQQIQECNDAEIQQACLYDKFGNSCFWNENNQCQKKLCENITIQELENKTCNQILENCIKNKYGNCMNKTNCLFIQIYQEFKIDCLSSYKNCYWQEDGEFCVEEKNNQSQNIIIKEKQQYCQQFIDMKTCLKIESCAWILLDKIYSCQTFPGCNFYQNTTHEECQSYSTLCISDGITCVQKHQNCIDYETQMSCEFIQQPQQYYCYWAMNLCLQANFCDLLPKSLNTDEQCRTAMKTCTVNIDQGCIDSGLNCSDQKNESQCYWNLDQTIQCIWVNNECFERNCKTLAQQLKTSNCKRDIKNYKCYEDGQNGCSEILVCQNLKSLSSCQNYQQECYWDVNTCIKRECYYAPNSFNTWEQCQDFSKECIPKLLYGCQQIQECNDAEIQQACLYDKFGNSCFWNENNQCQKKLCENITIQELENKTCNQILENCIKNKYGNCMNKTNCLFIQIYQECDNQYDINGKLCFWDEIKQVCLEKKCSNSPKRSSHQQCQEFQSTCTINKTGDQCVEWTCNISKSQEICEQSVSRCIWNQRCIEKVCEFASKNIKTHQECQDYLNSCTLSNLGYGCMNIPLKCEAITTKGGCVKRVIKPGGSKLNCGWYEDKCIDKACVTAPLNLLNDYQCDYYEKGCVIKYVKENQSIVAKGCQELSLTCEQRINFEQCIIQRIDYPVCIWIPNINVCKIKSCLTASIENSTGSLKEFNLEQCHSYSSNCIPNANNDGCINQQQFCYQLSKNNCFHSLEGNCFFNQNSCVLKICKNINQYSHESCYSNLKTCTVNSNLTGCQTLAKQCYEYISKDQCQITITEQKCLWENNYCRELECMDVPQIQDFNSYNSCQNQSSKCTVIRSLDICDELEYNCIDYKTQERCFRSANNAEDNCIWIYNRCYDQKSITNQVCSNFKGTKEICRQYKLGCTNVDNATIYNYCYFDCNQVSLANLTFQFCQSLSYQCSVNIQGTACVVMQPSCELYYQEESCFQILHFRCFYENGSCHTLISGDDCQKIQGPFTDEYCSLKNNLCLANKNQSSCIKLHYDCSNYLSEENCTRNQFNQRCIIINGLCTQISDPQNQCQLIQNQNGTLNYDYCSSYSNYCVGTQDQTNCFFIPYSCQEYNYDFNHCVYSRQGKCYYNVQYNICLSVQNPSTDCIQITRPSLLFQDCQSYNINCSVSYDGTYCIEIKDYCQYYNAFDQCYQARYERCISIQSNGIHQCISFNQWIPCKIIYLQVNQYNHFECNSKNKLCTNDSTTSCTEKNCSNYIGSEFNHNNCNTWKSDCTVSTFYDKCVPMLTKCSLNNIESCVHSYEGDCIVIDGICQIKQCQKAPDYLQTHSQCNEYSSHCTIAKVGGCVNKMACQFYSQIQCYSSEDNQNCFWNPSKKTCVVANCLQIETTELFDSHDECYYVVGLSIKCTVRSQNGVPIPGCMMLTQCSNYSIKQQCVISIDNISCEWNENFNPPQCMDKSCQTASNQLVKHEECNSYYLNCTVSKFIDPNTNQYIVGRCQELQSCGLYTFEEQCVIDINNNPCQWTGNYCTIKYCETAPFSDLYDTNQECKDYFGEDCVVSDFGKGCMTIKIKCEDYILEQQCQKNKFGQLCFWNSDIMKCLENTCQNIEQHNYEQCNIMNQNCFSPNIECRNLICEDLKYQTDFECEYHMKGCTTNGDQCVKRGSCLQAMHRKGCVKSNLGEICVWIIKQENDYGYCDIAVCDTAPTSYSTEEQCQFHNINCTVKKKGGCKEKSTCENFEQQEACIIDINGNKCFWEDYICRSFNCQDYKGLTYESCQYFNENCTLGYNGYCTQMLNCNQYTLKSMCYKGFDGICVWILDDQQTSDSEGQCYQFSQCESLQLFTDTKCKQASKLCTTNGINCVPLTSCNQTNINGGCVTGIDGECIMYFDIQKQALQCTLYKTCSQAQFYTYFDCQSANKKCTTNGQNCIEFLECNQYQNKVSCVKDKNQKNCSWDSYYCRDQQCQDYKLEDECEKHDCVWNENICNNKKKQDCFDFVQQEECNASHDELNCSFDGITCKPNQNIDCFSFLTEKICYQHKNPIDCFWQDNRCQRFQNCSDANNNKNACYQFSKHCMFIQDNCKPIDCQRYYEINGICSRIKTLDKKYVIFCSKVNDFCLELNPTTLTQSNCFQQSDQTFVWNTQTNKCEACFQDNSLDISNTTDINSPNERKQQQILSSIMILIFLLSIY
ncbi:unnamed protein product [Paramecium sonneborni]|uniref:Uncharacterized protein n=1 Tax=Paramecium sonneborni TaxID=65129 RepID=A0A8S1R3X4_9CILI|nr:unnamed protein product [Paramecium sonneborni]